MRNIEKGVLLAELFNADTSKYIPSFIEWIKSTPQYAFFVDKKNELKIKRTWKAKRFYSYFDTIDVDGISSIKDGMIEYGKLCYLVKITSEPSYVNPLIIENLDDEDMRIGDIKIEFDGKLITFKELAKLEGFTFDRKDELIKEKINNWVREVEETILEPVEEFKNHLFYLPKIKLFSASRIIEGVYLLLVNILMACVYFVDIPSFKGIFEDKKSIGYCLYLLALGFVLVYDIIYLIIMIYRSKKYGHYSKARKGVIEDIFIEKEKSETKLRLYLYEQISISGDMDKKISEFSKISKYYPYIGYIRKHLTLKRRVKVDKLTVAEKTAFIVTALSIIALVIIMFI